MCSKSYIKVGCLNDTRHNKMSNGQGIWNWEYMTRVNYLNYEVNKSRKVTWWPLTNTDQAVWTICPERNLRLTGSRFLSKEF